jgi:hypothetical protein
MRADVRYSRVARGQPELVATPGNPGERRRSVVAEADDVIARAPVTPSIFGITTGDFFTPTRTSIENSPASVTNQRYSTVPSFVHDVPAPPTGASDTSTNTMESPLALPHRSAFGQVITGPPGAGKSTYAHGMHQVSQCPHLEPLLALSTTPLGE